MNTKTFEVPEYRTSEVAAKIAKLATKAVKLGVPAPEVTYGVPVEYTKTDEFTGYKHVERYIPVTVSLEPVKLAGWSLVAALDHIEGGVISRVAPGMALPTKYQTADPENCDHCGLKRERKTTYVLLHEDGRYAQVGSNCLADFLGIDPAKLVASATFIRELMAMGDDEGGFGGGRGKVREMTVGFVALVARLIQKEGWTSRKVAHEDQTGRKVATSDSALHVLYTLGNSMASQRDRDEAREIYTSVTDEQKTFATDAVAWVRSQHDSPDLNDYMRNLTVLTVGDSFDPKYAGLVASIAPAYAREVGRELERKASRNSVHVGVVKARQSFTLTVTGVKTFDGDYGVRSLVTFVDVAGNQLKWWTSETDLEPGKTYTGKATVKAHEEYKGVKQTLLTRATLTEVVSVSPATETVGA